MKYNKIFETLCRARWSNEFEMITKPQLLFISLQSIISILLSKEFNAKEFVKESFDDVYAREIIRATFYNSINYMDKYNVENDFATKIMEDEQAKDIIKFWVTVNNSFISYSPIWDQETFWASVMSLSIEDDLDMVDAFAALIVFGLSKQERDAILNVFIEVLSLCKDDDAKYLLENCLKTKETNATLEQLTYANMDIVGKTYLNEEDCPVLYVGNEIVRGIYSKVFILLDIETVLTGKYDTLYVPI